MRRLLLVLAMCVVVTGCRHKPAPYVAAVSLPPMAPVPVDKAPEMASVPPVPAPAAPVTNVKLPKKVKKPKKKAAVPAPVAGLPGAVQVAGTGAPVPAASVVGALSAGGQDSPEKHKQAADLLAALKKRLAGLSSDVADKQKSQVDQVRHFWDEANKALEAGDADGAWTLATKARVLLDEVAS